MGKHEMPDDVRAAIEDDGIDPETGELLEPRPDDDEPLDPDESDPENAPEPQPQPAPLTEAKVEAIMSALDRYKSVVEREVMKRAEVMGEDLKPCPCCMANGPAPGFIVAELPEPHRSMRLQAVIADLGGTGEPEYVPDPDTETCGRCQGLGETQTGSKKPGQMTRACPDCNGMGWKTKVIPWSPPAAPNVPAAPPQVFAPQPFGNGGGDPWGRPVGHPHYGQNPALIGA